MRDAAAGATGLAVLALLSWSPPAAAGGAGTVEIRITDHRAGIADLAELRVTLAEVTFHPRGVGRGQGWVPGLGPTGPVDLVPLKDGRWARVGAAEVPAGRYDAVRIRFGPIEGRSRNGSAPVVGAAPTAVAVDLAVLPDRTVGLLLDLYVEDVSDHEPGHYVVKVKGVTAP